MIKKLFSNIEKRVLLPAFFFLGISSFLGCQKDDLNDTGFQPQGENLSYISTDTFSIQATTVKEDSVISFGYLYQLLGNMNEAVFGETKASIVSQLLLLEEDPAIIDASDIQIDSTLLVLDIQSVYGNDDPQDIKVQLLTEEVDSSNEIFSNNFPVTDPFEIGLAQQVEINQTDSIVLDGQTTAPGLVIPLYNTFGDFLLNNNRQALVSNDAFLDFIKGLYITSTSSFVEGDGGITRLNLNSSSTFLKVLYSSISTGEKYSISFRIGQGAAKYCVFENDYSSADINGYFNQPNLSSDKLFIQSNAGAFVQLDLPFLRNLSAQGLMIVHKAELIVPVENDDDLSYAPHPRLFITAVDESGDEQITLDQFEGDNHYGGRYDEANKEYKLRITREVQQIIESYQAGETPLTKYHLIPGDIIPGGAAINANRTIISGTDINLEDRFRIEISYTPVNQ